MLTRRQKAPYMEWLIVVCLLGNAFLPPLRLPGYAVQVSAAAAPVLLLVVLAYMKTGCMRAWWAIWLVVAMGFTCLLSTLWSYIVLGVPTNASDFVEAYKYLQFMPYLAAIQFVDMERFERALTRCIVIAAAVVMAVGFIQVISPGKMGFTVSELYGATEAQQVSMHIGNRLFLTGSDPNIGAGIGVFFLFYFCTSFFYSKKIAYAALSTVFLFLVIFTQSRTALAGVLFAFLLYGFTYSKAKLLTKIIACTTIIFLGYIIITKFNLMYIIGGIRQVGDGTNQSLNVRLGNIDQGVEWFMQSPWFGWGPAKSIHDTIIDSEYAVIVERYGCLGVVIFGVFIVKYIASSIKGIRLTSGRSVFPVCALLYMLFGTVFMTTNSLFSGYQLMSLLILLLCVVCGRSQLARTSS